MKFFVEVDNGYFEILINDNFYLKNFQTKLPPGKHSAKIWSPGYITNEVTFEVTENQVTEVHVPMAHSNERIEFENEYKVYRMNFHKSLTLPGTVTLAGVLTTGTFMTLAFDRKRKLLDLVDSYHAAPTYSEVLDYKSQINSNNQKFNRYRIGYYVAGGISVGALITTIYTYSRFKKNSTEPVLKATSPFADRFSFNPFMNGCTLKWRIG